MWCKYRSLCRFVLHLPDSCWLQNIVIGDYFNGYCLMWSIYCISIHHYGIEPSKTKIMIDFDVIGLQTVGLLIIADTCTDVHVLFILLALHINRIKKPHMYTHKKSHDHITWPWTTKLPLCHATVDVIYLIYFFVCLFLSTFFYYYHKSWGSN